MITIVVMVMNGEVHQMALEIERKFLVFADRLPPLTGGQTLVQGYLSKKPEVRFRIVEGRVILAVKKRLSPREKLEFEFPRDDMSEKEIRDLLGLALWPALTKIRYVVPWKGFTWEVDVYQGDNEGLVTADVEIPSTEHAIVFPEWIDSKREITGSKRYSNRNLTREPFCGWGEA